MKVLMTTDGSKHAATAMLSASRLLRKNELETDVLCIAPALALATPDAIRVTYTEDVRRQSQRIVRDAQNVLRPEGVHANSLVKFGSPVDDILHFAANYDLVVVGAHGKHERRQPGLGPVSSHVVQNAGRSVMVGRELCNENNYRVLVALDGSDASFNAMRALETYFDVSSMDVTLMHVIEMPWARLGVAAEADDSEGSEIVDYRQDLEREMRRFADVAIDRGSRQLEKWGIPGTTIIEEGDPALELVSHAEEGNYDLIVTGATGASDVKHALLGSVSVKLAWNAPCSVVVVRS